MNVKDCFDYKDGKLFWRVRPASHFSSVGRANIWNAKYAGTEAGSLHKSGYLHVSFDGKKHKLHRLIWEYHNGSQPEGVIDHINGDKADNRIENLRDVSQQTNCQNMKPRDNAVISGVYKRNKRGCESWYASISIDGMKKHLLSTKDLFEAICARKSAELKYYGA